MLKLGDVIIDGAAIRSELLKRMAGDRDRVETPRMTPDELAAAIRRKLQAMAATADRVCAAAGPEAAMQFLAEIRATIPSEEELRAAVGDELAADMIRIIREAVRETLR